MSDKFAQICSYFLPMLTYRNNNIVILTESILLRISSSDNLNVLYISKWTNYNLLYLTTINARTWYFVPIFLLSSSLSLLTWPRISMWPVFFSVFTAIRSIFLLWWDCHFLSLLFFLFSRKAWFMLIPLSTRSNL